MKLLRYNYYVDYEIMRHHIIFIFIVTNHALLGISLQRSNSAFCLYIYTHIYIDIYIKHSQIYDFFQLYVYIYKVYKYKMR